MTGHALVHWFETSIPILLVVWLAEFQVSYLVVGTVVALGYAPFGLGALPGGILADRYGTKRLIIASLFGMSLSFLLLALADSIVAIALGLVCWGIAASIYHPAGLSLISTGVAERGTVFAYHGIAGNVGIALGPFVTATLLIGVSWQVTAATLAVPGLFAAIYGLSAEFDPVAAVDDPTTGVDTTPASLHELMESSRALFGSAFALVFVIVIFEGLFYRGLLTYLPEILQGLPALAAFDPGLNLQGINPGDYIYVGLLVVGMAGQYVGGRLTDRFPTETGLVGLFGVLAALALLFVPVSGLGITPLIVLCGMIGFCLFAIQPFYQNAVAVHTPPSGRGLSYGYTYLGEFGLGSASIAVGGFLLGGFAVAVFFGVLSTFAIVGAVLSTVLWRRYGRQ